MMESTKTDIGPTEYTPGSSPCDEIIPLDEANALERVSNLRLVASTWELMTAYYTSAKKTYPSVTPYLEIAEKITTGAANVALTTTRPVLDKLAPTVNTYANRGLDKLEDALPLIHDEPEEVYGSAKAAVTTAVTRRIDSALKSTEKCIDYYLPPAKEEKEYDDDEEESDDESDASSTSTIEYDEQFSPKERLQVISHKVRRRAYTKAMDKIRGVQRRSVETLGKLQFTVDLIQYARENMEAAQENISSKVSSANDTIRQGVATSQENIAAVWKEVKSRSSEAAAEVHLLEKARTLTKSMQQSFTTLLSVVTKLPSNEYISKKIALAKESADVLAHELIGKKSLSELSSGLFETARANIQHVRSLLESLISFLSKHAPMDWLAPEFNCDPLEGLFMQDLEAELHMNENNIAENAANRERQSGQVRFRRG